MFSLTIENKFNSESAIEVANISIKEANSIFESSVENWKFETEIKSKEQSVKIYSSQVSVNNIKSNTSVMRIKLRIGKNADEFFKFLTSIEGYKFLDPDSKPEDFGIAILGPFKWGNDESKVQAEYAKLEIGGCIAPRDYVVMNAHDYKNRRWYCKTIDLDGNSSYSGNTSYSNNGIAVRSNQGNCIRMAYYVTYSVEPIEGDANNCTLELFQWFDMEGWMQFASNPANKTYLEKFIHRATEQFPVKK